jgi:hypothetical protein
MDTSPTSFLAEILDEKEKIPQHKLVYFRTRVRHRIYDLVVREFLRWQKDSGLTKKDLARRIDRQAAQITRWLSYPGNWTLDTVSDLLLAMRAEPEFSVALIAERIAATPEPKQTSQLASLIPPRVQTSPLGGDQSTDLPELVRSTDLLEWGRLVPSSQSRDSALLAGLGQ